MGFETLEQAETWAEAAHFRQQQEMEEAMIRQWEEANDELNEVADESLPPLQTS